MKRFISVTLIALILAMALSFSPLNREDKVVEAAAEATFYSSTSDGHIAGSDTVWNDIRDAATGSTDNSGQLLWVNASFNDPNYSIARMGMYFDTTSIPDSATINSASLYLWGSQVNNADTCTLIVRSGMPTYPHNPMVDADYDRTFYAGNGGSILVSALSTAAYNEIELDATGRGWINKVGTTKLVILNSRDVNDTDPTGENKVAFQSADYAGTDRDPKLVINYTVPDIAEEDTYYGIEGDGMLYETNAVYATARAEAEGTVEAVANTMRVGQQLSGGNYTIWRGALFFNTSYLPDNCSVDSVTLSLYGYAEAGAGKTYYVTVGDSLGTPLVAGHYGAVLEDALYWGSANIGSVDNTAWETGQYNDIALESVNIAQVNTRGYTRIAIIAGDDYDGSDPAGDEWIDFYTYEGGALKQPKLYISYTIPDLGDPEALAIEGLNVFSNLLEDGDQLFVFRSKVLYPYVPEQDPRHYFVLQILDSEGAALNQVVLQTWGYAPSSIYVNVDEAVDWGGNYTIRIMGNPNKYETPPSVTLQVPASGWIGADLNNLDAWVKSTTTKLETYSGLTLHEEQYELWKLNDLGASLFDKGIPGLRSSRSHLFIFTEYFPDYTESDHPGTTALGLADNLGDQMIGYFDAIGEPFNIGGKNLAGVVWILIMAMGMIVAGTLTTSIGAGLVVGLPIMFMGIYLGVIPMVIIAVMASLLAIYVVYRIWIRGS